MRVVLLSILFLFLVRTCFESKAETLPNITAHSWIVADDKGRIIDGINTDHIRPIASITKLITVMIVLDANQSLDESIHFPKYHMSMTRQMLIDLTIVKSDNAAAVLLCQNYPSGYDECIHMMNRKSQELAMLDTRLSDPTGLNSENVSTAVDLVKLVQAASKYPIIVGASQLAQVKVLTSRKNWTTLRNTNPLVGHGYDFIVSKTGFINKSGGCIVMMLNTINGVRTVVLLGSKNTRTRIPEAALISAHY